MVDTRLAHDILTKNDRLKHDLHVPAGSWPAFRKIIYWNIKELTIDFFDGFFLPLEEGHKRYRPDDGNGDRESVVLDLVDSIVADTSLNRLPIGELECGELGAGETSCFLL